VEIDKGVSSDGNGSLRITATGPTVVRLFETGDIDVEMHGWFIRLKCARAALTEKRIWRCGATFQEKESSSPVTLKHY
jgi:hypothetical protein